jgi:hypothetical protein
VEGLAHWGWPFGSFGNDALGGGQESSKNSTSEKSPS